MCSQESTDSSVPNTQHPESTPDTSKSVYGTFSSKISEEPSPTASKCFQIETQPHWLERLVCLTLNHCDSSQSKAVGCSRSTIAAFVTCMLIAALATFRAHDRYIYRASRDGIAIDYASPASKSSTPIQEAESELRWDHNVYYGATLESVSVNRRYSPKIIPNTDTHLLLPAPVGRNLLIAQVTIGPYGNNHHSPSHSAEERLLTEFADITSRPNRAYARQWGRNFVRFQSKGTIGLAIASFVKGVLERQQDPQHLIAKRVLPYDAIALLLPGAIIVDLDYDLLALIPDDKLLAIAGLEGERSKDSKVDSRNRVIFVNLRHHLAKYVIDLWWEVMKKPPHQGNNNSGVKVESDYSLNELMHIIDSALDEGEDWRSVMFQLVEADDGYVLEAPYSINTTRTTTADFSAPFCIKSVSTSAAMNIHAANLPISAQLLLDPELTRATLQTTADAVCYRYYPKCEIL